MIIFFENERNCTVVYWKSMLVCEVAFREGILHTCVLLGSLFPLSVTTYPLPSGNFLNT